jgi:hypothetical protein
LVEVRADNAAPHDIAHLEIHIVDRLWRLNLKTLKHKAHLWFEISIARSDGLLFAL